MVSAVVADKFLALKHFRLGAQPFCVHKLQAWKTASTMDEAKRGGNRRQSIPVVLLESLQAIFKVRYKEMTESAFDLGVYNNPSKSSQPVPTGLVQHASLIEQLVKISNGEIRPSQLQQCIAEYPSCNDTNYNIGTWSLQKATAVTTLLAQWRRLKYEPKRLQNCLARCTQAQSKVVLKLFQLDPGLSRAMPQDDDPQTITKRKLKAQASTTSLDSHGYPMMLKDVATPSPNKMVIPTHRQRGKGTPPQAQSKPKPATLPLCPEKPRLDFNGLQQKLLEEAQGSCLDFPEQHCMENAEKAKNNKEKSKPRKRPAACKGSSQLKKRPAACKGHSQSGLDNANLKVAWKKAKSQ